jgi:transglutaminase-like putative cysteine protease
MRGLLYLVSALVVLALPVLCRTLRAREITEGSELLKNPAFERRAEGWLLRSAVPEPELRPGDRASVRLDGVEPGPQSWSHAGVAISPVPADRELRFDCEVRAQVDGQRASVNVFGYDKDHDLTFLSSTPFDLVAGKWTRLRQEYVFPHGTTTLTAWIINSTAHPISVSDAHLRVGGPKKAGPRLPKRPKDGLLGWSRSAPLDGPGVVRARAQAAVATRGKADVGVLTFPIPGTYRDQVPLTFDVKVEPPGALKSYRWVRRPDGRNWLCEVTVAPKQDGAQVRWEALVLVDRGKNDPLPRAAQPEAPEETAPWTRSTACVQSDDPAVRAKAEELAKGTAGVEPYARRVIEFTAHHQGKGGVPFDALDARKGLDCGGSCTSRANLAAALLRARGIPARTVAHLPTWSGPLYEHWLVEYWHPGAGWVWLESSLGQFRPLPCTLVVLGVANPEDEDRAFDPLQTRQVMPGAPYLSVHVGSERLHPAPQLAQRLGGADNVAIIETRLSGTEEDLAKLFSVARSAFETLVRECEAGVPDAARAESVRIALRSKNAADLAAAVRRDRPDEAK